jgi:hypothetical protein
MKILRLGLVLFLLLVLTTTMASAGPPDHPQHPGPAMFNDYPDCWIMDIELEWFHIEDCSPHIDLISNSRTGVLLWHAQAQLPVDDPDVVLPERGAFHITYENSGFACWWAEDVETTNYSITITPNGKFNVSCHFRPDKWQPE